ncbi:MAG: hypothetical protein H6739_20565 [Alphaproteobacteria bacterium]|nr:hypothetical protein [Alphaproteobacteria bacterium]
MDSYVIWSVLDGVVQVGIAAVQLLCAAALMFRFRSHPLAALPAALGFAFFALIGVTYVAFGLANVWSHDWAPGVGVGLHGCSVVAAFGVVVGVALAGRLTGGAE